MAASPRRILDPAAGFASLLRGSYAIVERADDDALRHRPRSQRGELSAADTAVVSGPRRRSLSEPNRDHPRQAFLDLSAIFCANAAIGVRARAAWHQARRYGRG